MRPFLRYVWHEWPLTALSVTAWVAALLFLAALTNPLPTVPEASTRCPCPSCTGQRVPFDPSKCCDDDPEPERTYPLAVVSQ